MSGGGDQKHMLRTGTKIWTLCMLLSLAALFPAAASGTQQVFDRANHLYQEHRYDSAAILYGRLIAQGYDNPELYYNAGNANFKARHLGYAIYYFEKALQQSPDNEVIAHNLDLANQEVTDKIDQVPVLFFVRWWNNLLHLHSPNGWMTGSLVFFWVLAFFVGWRLLRRPAPRWTRWTVAVSAVLFCVYLACAAGSWYHHAYNQFAVIVRDDGQLKAAPDSGSAEVLVLHEGLKVRVMDEVNGWRKIRLPDGKEGWVKAGAMLDL